MMTAKEQKLACADQSDIIDFQSDLGVNYRFSRKALKHFLPVRMAYPGRTLIHWVEWEANEGRQMVTIGEQTFLELCARHKSQTHTGETNVNR